MFEEKEQNSPLYNASSLLSSKDFMDLMYDKKVPLEHVRIDGELFYYWRKKGLTPFFQKGAWARFSLAQVLWLEILLNLRDFGLSLEKLKHITEYFYLKAYQSKLAQNILAEQLQGYKKQELAGTLTMEDKAWREVLLDISQDEAKLYHLRLDINYYTELLNICLRTGQETGILIYSDGQIAEFALGQYYSKEIEKVDPSRPHIYLSLRYYLKKLIDDQSLREVVTPLQVFNDQEQKIFREIRNPKVKELRIELKEGSVHRIESTYREKVITDSQAEKIRQILGLGNYERISLDSIDEKSILYRKTKKMYK